MNFLMRIRRNLAAGDYIIDTDIPTENVWSMDIERVIFNDPATIVIWKDGTRTVVKCRNEHYDPEKGLAMAIVKKTFGNKGNYYNVFKKYLSEHEESKLSKSGLDWESEPQIKWVL